MSTSLPPPAGADGASTWAKPSPAPTPAATEVPYRSPKRLATAVRWLFVAAILVAGVDAAANAEIARLVSRVQADANLVGPVQLDTADQRAVVTAAVQAVVFLVGLGFLIAWTSRAYRNLVALGARDLRFTTGWAIGSWFVPFLNLIRPKQILDDVWRVSCLEGDADDWHRRPVSPLLHVWWGLWIVGALLGLSASASSDLSSVQRTAISSCVADGVLIIACALAIVVITRMTEGQELRATGNALKGSGTWEHAVWAAPVASMALFAAAFAGLAAAGDEDVTNERRSDSSEGRPDSRRTVLVTDLELGHCIDEPRDEPVGPSREAAVLAVNVRPCHQRHDAEVVGVVRHPAGDDAEYPGLKAIFEYAEAACVDAFEEWVGTRFSESSLDVVYLYPREDGWELGDRTIQCLAFPLDGQPLERSVRGTGI